MKVFFVRTVEGNLGLAGPVSHLSEIEHYEPPVELRGQAVEMVVAQGDVQSAIKLWDWEKSSWTLIDRSAIKASDVKVEVVFGELVPPLSKQLDGLGFSDEQIEHWQKDLDAIDRLRTQDYISEMTAHKAYENLARRIK